ncbi:MAG: hypothetical protein D3916_19090, partial [Candidatus Electrothrix sp. MAN1_4]|nr:hypothetical protein [Candidatus Electrothrix sp. MAN1_4]
LSSLFMAASIPGVDNTIPHDPEDDEPLLESDHASPVGYRVPSLPDFEVDPTTALDGAVPLGPVAVQILIGLFIAVLFGGGIIYIGISDEDDNFWDR